MLKKIVLWTPIFCFVSLLVAFISIDRATYGSLTAQYIAAKAKDSGLVLSFSKPELTWLGLKSEVIKIGWPKFLLTVETSNFESDLDPSWSVFSDPAINFRSKMLQGDIVGRVVQSGNTTKSADLAFNNLKISEMSQFLAFGIEQCFLGGTFKLDTSQDFQGFLQLDQCSKPKSSKLSPSLTGLPFEVELPTVTGLNLRVKLGKVGPRLQIEQAELNCSLLSATAQGDISAINGPIPRLNLSASVMLTADGSRDIGKYLILLGLKPEQRSFRLNLKGSPNRPILTDENGHVIYPYHKSSW